MGSEFDGSSLVSKIGYQSFKTAARSSSVSQELEQTFLSALAKLEPVEDGQLADLDIYQPKTDVLT